MFSEYPLSPMQASMLSAALFDSRRGTYTQQMVLHTTEDLDDSAFRAAWSAIVERHPILRTAFRWQGLIEPQQFVVADATMPWVDADWTEMEAGQCPAKLEALLEDDRARGFALDTAPLHRLVVIRAGSQERWIIWTYHHALLDGRARLVLIEELFHCYEALRSGIQPQFAPTVSYENYIRWLQRQDFSGSEAYWRCVLDGFSEPNRILSGRSQPRRLRSAEKRGEVSRDLPESVCMGLRGFAETLGATLNTVVQAAWALLVAKHSGLDDVLFGATISCRKSVPDGDAIIGPIINTVPIRVRVDRTCSVADFIRALRSQHRSVRQHEHTPLSRIVEWSAVPRGQPLFSTIVVFENYHLATRLRAKGGEWAKREFELKEQTDYLALAAYAGERLLLKIEYDRSLFDDDLADRMLGQVCTLLGSMALSPQVRLSELQLLPDEERARLLVTWNATAVALCGPRTLAEVFYTRAAQTPNATAVAHSGTSLSYGELDSRSNRLARLLLGKGVGRGTVVGVLLDRCLELPTAYLGVLKSGGGYLPLDPGSPKSRLQYMIGDSGVTIVLSREAFAQQVDMPGVEIVILDAQWSQIEASCKDSPPAEVDIGPEDLAYLMYTSGSTGEPKGVMIPHRAVVNLCEAIQQRYALHPGDRVLQHASLIFDISVEELYPTWHAGATVVLREDSRTHSIAEFIAWAGSERITVFNLPTAFWNELAAGLKMMGDGLPKSLRLVVVGGERASRATLETWRSIPGAARVRWLNTYGPTETTVTATVYEPPSDLAADALDGDLAIGKPIGNTRVYVLDAYLEPVPIGVPGELFIAGLGVASGYFARPKLTAAAFLADPFGSVPGERMYRTGDIVRYSAVGELRFVGRNDDQVKISGFRIEPGEIEAAIESHDRVRQAVVTAAGSGVGRYLVAYVVPFEANSTKAEDLAVFLGAQLPAHMLPRVYVMMERLPMTPSGKLDRKSLPEPEATKSRTGGTELPRDAIEEKLIELFKDIFPTRQIGRRDHFFDIGGDSLRAFRLLIALELTFGQRLSFSALTDAGTVEGLANLIRAPGRSPARRSCVVPMQTEGSGPALFLVHGVGGAVHWYRALAVHLSPVLRVYGIQSPGIDDNDDEAIGADIQKLARLYLDEIQCMQAHGPYFLGGHSMGGIIAFEMACQLQAKGDEVGLVANFDNWNRAADAPGLAAKALRLGRHFMALSTAGKARFLSEKARWLREAWHVRQPVGGRHPDYARLSAMKAANTRAAQHYVPQFYPGRLTIFRARIQNATALNDPKLGWGGMASDIDVVEVPGDHYTMLSEPNVAAIAEELKRRLVPA